MKYSMEEYRREMEKAGRDTCDGNLIEERMRPFREALYQGLEIGDGVTVHLWSDAHAGTIIRRTGSTLWIRRDRAIRTDSNGMSDCQEYRYEPNEAGTIYTARWSKKYSRFLFGGKSITIGRHEYYDYTF